MTTNHTDLIHRLRTATFDKLPHLVNEAADALEAMQADAARWRYVVTHAEWFRNEDERDRHSSMCVRLPYEADQSCVATRTDAIDAARGQRQKYDELPSGLHHMPDVKPAARKDDALPDPFGYVYVEDPWGANEHHWMLDTPDSQNCDPRDWTPLYTADQLRAAIAAERDERLQITAYADALNARCIEDTAELATLREVNDRFGKRQEWWTERMFELEQERDSLREQLQRERREHQAAVHSCHDDCKMAGCVNVRLRQQLAEAEKNLSPD